MASQDLVNTKSDISLVTCLSFTDRLQGQNTKPSVGQFSQLQICLIVCFLFFSAKLYLNQTPNCHHFHSDHNQINE